ncbi:LysR family transcriptional regulator [Rhizobium sp. P32RR-XVIII]|uniref:LysR family transcriptional regulator n=1 Tax=Rhizobium sp. P32RR-XVIII TaxID=2726738 RepID=UPI0014577DE6|nr:LysR family transcriptional regulator [Rhizobium sp. P32RR-XVIII]NLS02754.1 LysR family transcriptional regulator [Rhizobium sp. P32RR-XVIII]
MAEQKRTDVDWEDLRFFTALARHGSLSAAARALKVNHATVARRMSALEAVLGVQLFERRPDGYALTAHGQSIATETTAMAEAASAIRDRVASPEGPSGRVRITTTRSIADLVLAPRLTDLLSRLPAVELEIITDVRVQSLAHREADIALRLGRPKDSELTGKRVAVVSHAFFANEDVARCFQAGEDIPLIGYDLNSDLFIAEARWLEAHHAHRAYSVRSGSSVTQAIAAVSGLGIAMLPRFLARQYPSLREVAFGDVLPDRELWMLAPPSLLDVPRVRAIWERLSALFLDTEHR